MERHLEEIQRKVTPILKRHQVKRAGLFGSAARGEMKPSSDVDILVELDREKSLLDLVALKLELEEALGVRVDVVEYSVIPSRLEERILREQVSML